MPLIHVDSPDDPRLADYVSLRDVQLRTSLEATHGLFLAEGEKVIRRAVAAGYAVRSFLMAPRWTQPLADVLDAAGADVPCYVVPDDVVEQVTGFHVHRGALASLARRPLPSLDTTLRGARRVVVLEDLVDHTNVGAAFRSAAALGWDAVLLSPRCADPLYRRSIKVSMGTVFAVPYTRIEDWYHGPQLLHDAGFEVLALTPAADAVDLEEVAARYADAGAAAAPSGPGASAADPSGAGASAADRDVAKVVGAGPAAGDPSAAQGADVAGVPSSSYSGALPKVALLVGTEGEGLSERWVRSADARVRIPMAAGVDSLNVAAATAVACYALRP